MKKFLELRVKAYDALISDNQKKLNNPLLNTVEQKMLKHDQLSLMLYRVECLSILSHLNVGFDQN